MSIMRKTKEDAEVTREKLMDAGLRVFSKNGYASTTLDDIAREAGVTRGALYWHFKGGKPDIYQAILTQRCGRVEATIAKIFAEDLPPLEKLEHLMVGLMEFVEDDEDYRAVQELTLFKTGMSQELAEGCLQRYEANRASLKMVEQLIGQAKKEGKVREDVDPKAAAIAALGLLNGVVLIWMLDNTLYPLKKYSRKVVGTFIDGIAVR